MSNASEQHSHRVARLVRSVHTEQFPLELEQLVRDICQFHWFVLLAYSTEGELIVLRDGHDPATNSTLNESYRQKNWLLSPLYLASQRGYRGYFHISDIADAEFRHSAFFRDYYSTSGLADQAGYIFSGPNGSSYVVSLGRSGDLPPFSTDEREAIAAQAELIEAFIGLHWKTAPTATDAPLARDQDQDWSDYVLGLIECEALTPREQDVLLLILKGLQNKQIARELGISPETVKFYCRQINQKLGTESRAKLIAHVLELLMRRQ